MEEYDLGFLMVEHTRGSAFVETRFVPKCPNSEANPSAFVMELNRQQYKANFSGIMRREVYGETVHDMKQLNKPSVKKV